MCSSPNIISMINLNECGMQHGTSRKCIQNFGHEMMHRDQLQDLGVDEMIILNLISMEPCTRLWAGFILLRLGN
jgi:hypothetical protein